MRRLLVLLALLAAVPALAHAATPPSQDVAVPASGEATFTWSGTIPPGSNPTSSCPAGGDAEELKLTVPDGLYANAEVEATFSISWTPAATGDTSDEILDGHRAGRDLRDERHQRHDRERRPQRSQARDLHGDRVRLRQRRAPALRRQARPARQRPGERRAERALRPRPAACPSPPPCPSDPQRDESEPNMEIDNDGNIYTCGPTGFSNASDYAQVSTDGGDQFHLLGEPPRGQQGSGGGGDCGLATGAERNEREAVPVRLHRARPADGLHHLDVGRHRAHARHRRAAGQRQHRQGRPRRPAVDGVPGRQDGAALLQPAAAAQHRRAEVDGRRPDLQRRRSRPGPPGRDRRQQPELPGPDALDAGLRGHSRAPRAASPTSAGTSP